MFFGFTNCPDVCPTTLATLAEVRRQRSRTCRRPTAPAVVLVSVDPGRDTPEVLGRYVAHFDPQFVGVTGPPASLDVLARDLGVALIIGPPSADGSYSVDHTAAIFLIDPRSVDSRGLRRPHEAGVIARDYRSIVVAAHWTAAAVTSRSIGERAFIGLQYLLPQHFLSRLVGALAERRASACSQPR